LFRVGFYFYRVIYLFGQLRDLTWDLGGEVGNAV